MYSGWTCSERVELEACASVLCWGVSQVKRTAVTISTPVLHYNASKKGNSRSSMNFMTKPDLERLFEETKGVKPCLKTISSISPNVEKGVIVATHGLLGVKNLLKKVCIPDKNKIVVDKNVHVHVNKCM